jgi:hypothetical protein
MSRIRIAVAVGLVVPSLATAGQGPPVDPITEWSQTASALADSTGMSPFRAPITLALLHVAMFEAITRAAGDRQPAADGEKDMPAASAQAAAIEAGHQILLAEFPTASPAIAAACARLLDSERDTADRANGIRLGAEVAAALLRSRAGDGRNAAVPYTPGGGPGAWVPTPPAFLAENTAFLARVTPFAMDRPSRVRPDGPPSLRSRRWADDYNEVKRKGSRNSIERTPAETATALFWEPVAGTVWPATIRRLAGEQRLAMSDSARFQAAAFVAFADALIACWDAKYAFTFWRPITAIRQGHADGNDRTEPDPGWEPLGVTPNFPEYASGHVCVTAAVAHTIEHFFDRRVPMPARNVVTGEERIYRRADDLVGEVVEARMLLGVHFRSADVDGANIGREVAAHVRRRFLSPAESRPLAARPLEPPSPDHQRGPALRPRG